MDQRSHLMVTFPSAECTTKESSLSWLPTDRIPHWCPDKWSTGIVLYQERSDRDRWSSPSKWNTVLLGELSKTSKMYLARAQHTYVLLKWQYFNPNDYKKQPVIQIWSPWSSIWYAAKILANGSSILANRTQEAICFHLAWRAVCIHYTASG